MAPESTILLIEDNATTRKLLTAVLKKLNCQLLTAVDGEHGVEYARAHLPQLILMDIQLPGISGIEAARLIKAGPATSAIPIVALTAHAHPEEKEAALYAGCCAYITKPVDTRTFPDQIRQFLPR